MAALRSKSLVPAGLIVESVTEGETSILVAAKASAMFCTCPLCGVASRRVHSRYRRTAADLPASGRSVRITIVARRFRCDVSACPKQIFSERFGDEILAPSARRTSRLEVIVHHLGLALGGRPADGKSRHARSVDDRRDAPEGPPHGGQPAQKGAVPRCIGRTKGGLNSKLHAVCDDQGRPRIMHLSEGQMSDYKGAALLLEALPSAKVMIADRGYDAGWFREALTERGIAPCIPSKANRRVAIPHDRHIYRNRHKIENMFGRLKDWRRIHTRYDRCAHTFMSAICFAAAVIFWI